MTSEPTDAAKAAGLLQGVVRLLAWVGAYTTSLGVVLTALGYLVESAYLSTLGVPRGTIELPSGEYIATGGKFIIGLLPVAFAGSAQLVIRAWPFLLAIAALVALVRWRRWAAPRRWVAFAALHAVWLGVAIPKVEGATDEYSARAWLAILSFTTILAAVYVWFEYQLAASAPAESTVKPRGGAPESLARVPFLATLMVATIMLPTYRGAHGLVLEPPTIELSAKNARDLCEFAGAGAETPSRLCEAERWRLIKIGKDKVLLQNISDRKLYVSPVNAVQAFRVVKEAQP